MIDITIQTTLPYFIFFFYDLHHLVSEQVFQLLSSILMKVEDFIDLREEYAKEDKLAS